MAIERAIQRKVLMNRKLGMKKGNLKKLKWIIFDSNNTYPSLLRDKCFLCRFHLFLPSFTALYVTGRTDLYIALTISSYDPRGCSMCMHICMCGRKSGSEMICLYARVIECFRESDR